MRASEVDEVEAAVRRGARQVRTPVHGDRQHGMGAAGALVHFRVCHRAVRRTLRHDSQYFFCTADGHLQSEREPNLQLSNQPLLHFMPVAARCAAPRTITAGTSSAVNTATCSWQEK